MTNLRAMTYMLVLALISMLVWPIAFALFDRYLTWVANTFH